MRWIRIGLVAAGLTVAVVAASPRAPQQGCLNGTDATPEQKARRSQLIGLARAIHNQQVAAMQKSKSYSAASGLTLTNVPEGVTVKVSADSQGYSIFIVDTTDRCRSGVFSNEAGLIYTGQALQ